MPDAFLTQLARPRPDPGGGAAAAYGAEVAVALLLKVARLETSRSSQDEGSRNTWEHLSAAGARLGRRFRQLRDEDVEAYRSFAQAQAAGRGLAPAVKAATLCPLAIMTAARETLELVARAGDLCRPHLLSDLLVAAELLGGALQGAGHIAAANLPWIEPESERHDTAAQVVRTRQEGDAALVRVRRQLAARTDNSGGP